VEEGEGWVDGSGVIHLFACPGSGSRLVECGREKKAGGGERSALFGGLVHYMGGWQNTESQVLGVCGRSIS